MQKIPSWFFAQIELEVKENGRKNTWRKAI